MKLKNLRKTETWIYDITEPLEYDDHIVGEIEITFMNGKFVGIDWPFRGRYTLEQLDILAEAIAKAHKIEKQYQDSQKKRCYVCGVLEGELHRSICSVGKGIFRG